MSSLSRSSDDLKPLHFSSFEDPTLLHFFYFFKTSQALEDGSRRHYSARASHLIFQLEILNFAVKVERHSSVPLFIHVPI